MTRICLLIIYLCLALIPFSAEGTQQPRPFSGSGVVIIRPLNPESQVVPAPIPFYRDPGVARIVERHAGGIPNLSSILNMPAGEYPLAVMGKKGNWLRIAYDDAGREGWVEMSRWWEYTTWEVYLKGRLVRLLPGLKKSEYALHAGPAETAALTGILSRQENLWLIEVKGDWVLVITNSGLNGWLPWRDGDGRFLISIGEKINPQKH
jgi:hypothetical protein